MNDWWNQGLPSGGQTGGGGGMSPPIRQQTGGGEQFGGKSGMGGGIGQDNRSIGKMLTELQSVMPAAQRRYGAGQGVPMGRGGSSSQPQGQGGPDFSQFSLDGFGAPGGGGGGGGIEALLSRLGGMGGGGGEQGGGGGGGGWRQTIGGLLQGLGKGM